MTIATAVSSEIEALRATAGLAVHRCARDCDAGLCSNDSKVVFDDFYVVPL